MTDDALWTVPRAAQFTNESTSVWWKRVLRGVVPSFKLGKSRRLAAADVHKFLEDCREKGGRHACHCRGKTCSAKGCGPEAIIGSGVAHDGQEAEDPKDGGCDADTCD